MKISILLLTIDRYELTKQIWEHNIRVCGVPIEQLEFLVCDNGSTDKRVIEYFNPIAHYHRVNSRNEGIGKALNQLYLRSTGSIICNFGNDTELPESWLARGVEALNTIEKPGIVGITHNDPGVPRETKHGFDAHWLTEKMNRVFGTWMYKREMIEQVGFFCELYGPYGIEDSDFNERVNRMGFNSCYLPGLRSKHLVEDVGQQTDYRKMKDESMGRNWSIFGQRIELFNRHGVEREPLPPLREPL